MTDRELLELAAKAAGLSNLTEWSDRITDNDSKDYWQPALHAAGVSGECRSWNALLDDGDALRLAVTLCMEVYVDTHEHGCHCTEAWSPVHDGEMKCRAIVNHESDPLGATRRAIVIVAAEIGSRQ